MPYVLDFNGAERVVVGELETVQLRGVANDARAKVDGRLATTSLFIIFIITFEIIVKNRLIRLIE